MQELTRPVDAQQINDLKIAYQLEVSHQAIQNTIETTEINAAVEPKTSEIA